MARVQTRRGVSINGSVYARLRTYSNDRGVSMSAVVEAAILPHIEKWEREQGKKP